MASASRVTTANANLRRTKIDESAIIRRRGRIKVKKRSRRRR
jgi:hypothetical protein